MSVHNVLPSLGRHPRLVNKEEDVCSLGDFRDSLREASKLFTVEVFVEAPVMFTFRGLPVFHDLHCLLFEYGIDHF